MPGQWGVKNKPLSFYVGRAVGTLKGAHTGTPRRATAHNPGLRRNRSSGGKVAREAVGYRRRSSVEGGHRLGSFSYHTGPSEPQLTSSGPVFPIYRDWSRSGIKPCNPKNQIWDYFIPIRLRNQKWDKYHFSGMQLWQRRARRNPHHAPSHRGLTRRLFGH